MYSIKTKYENGVLNPPPAISEEKDVIVTFLDEEPEVKNKFRYEDFNFARSQSKHGSKDFSVSATVSENRDEE